MPGFVVAAMFWPMAIVIYGARPRNPANRTLAFFLAAVGTGHAARALSVLHVDAAGSFAWHVADRVILWVFAVPAVYAFIATFRTPWVRPLRSGWVRVVFLALWIPMGLARVVRPSLLVASVEPGGIGTWTMTDGPGFLLFALQVVLLGTFGMAASVSAWRRAPAGSVTRSRSRALALALAALLLPAIVVAPAVLFGAGPELEAKLQTLGLMAGYVVFLIVASFAVLGHQILDIDLKIKRGISRAPVAAVIAGAVFLISEGIEIWLDIRSTVPALVAAGVVTGAVALAFRPLLHLGDRLAERVLPGVEDTASYHERRAREVYRAALENAVVDGVVTDAERAVLDGLQKDLGLGAAEARRLERGVLEGNS